MNCREGMRKGRKKQWRWGNSTMLSFDISCINRLHYSHIKWGISCYRHYRQCLSAILVHVSRFHVYVCEQKRKIYRMKMEIRNGSKAIFLMQPLIIHTRLYYHGISLSQRKTEGFSIWNVIPMDFPTQDKLVDFPLKCKSGKKLREDIRLLSLKDVTSSWCLSSEIT